MKQNNVTLNKTMLLLICNRLFHNVQSYDDVTTPYKLLNWIQKDKLNYDNLSSNHKAVQLLEQNPDKINWNNLSQNPNAIHLLQQNPDKINWDILSYNPAIFEIDYNALYKRIEPFKEQLIAQCFHPDRLVRYLEKYNYDIGDEEYLPFD